MSYRFEEIPIEEIPIEVIAVMYEVMFGKIDDPLPTLTDLQREFALLIAKTSNPPMLWFDNEDKPTIPTDYGIQAYSRWALKHINYRPPVPDRAIPESEVPASHRVGGKPKGEIFTRKVVERETKLTYKEFKDNPNLPKTHIDQISNRCGFSRCDHPIFGFVGL